MAIITLLIKKPVSTLIVFIIVMLLGLMLSTSLSLELLPSINLPIVTIRTPYTNASPQEVEDSVTKPIEEALQGIENLDEVTSYSTEGNSTIIVQFNFGSDIDENVNNIKERLETVTRILPQEENVTPTLLRFSTDDNAIVSIGISANRSANEIRQIADDSLDSVFQQIPGVAYTTTYGGDTKKVYVNVLLNKLKEYELSFSEIQNAIQLNGQRSSIGSVETNVKTINVLLDTKFNNIEKLKNLIVSIVPDISGVQSYIRLSDVAEVYNGFEETVSSYALLDGKSVVQVDFYKQVGENIVSVSDNILASFSDFENASPADFTFTVIEDNSEFIRSSVKSIIGAILSGAFLAIIVLIVFLRSFSSVAVISISLPTSIITTLMMMVFFGQTLNIMTMAGLVLGIGMLVDNSIVVLENIYLKRAMGVRLLPASEYGAKEMTRPIFASTMTTVLVFLPIILFKNELETLGAIFMPLTLTIISSLLSSFIVAAFLLPVMTSKYIPINPTIHTGFAKKFDILFENFFDKVTKNYKTALLYVLTKRKRFIALTFFIALSPLSLVPFLSLGFFPSFKAEGVHVSLEFPSGTSADDILQTTREVEKEIADANIMPSVKLLNINANSDSGGNNQPNDSKAGKGELTYLLKKDLATDSSLLTEIKQKIILITRNYAGIIATVSNVAGGGGPPRGTSNADFTLEVKSDDYITLLDAVETYTETVKTIPGLTNITDNQPNQSFQYTIDIDTAKANLSGVNIAKIASELKSALSGVNAAKFTEGAKDRDIFLRLRDVDRKQANILEQLEVKNNSGNLIPISNFMTISPTREVKRIIRKNFRRTITISGELVAGNSISTVVAQAKKMLTNIPKDDSVIYEFSGTNEDLQKAIKTMIKIFIIAILFVFGVMATQFESFVDPFIIIFTIPLTIFGVILIYLATQYTLTVFSIIGIVVLAGVAVNHGIVMIDYMNLLRKRNYKLKDAVIESCTTRLQPILMTTLTTVLGLLPTALLDLTGSEFIRPIALTVVGGLSTSAILSLFLMPMLYYSFHNRLLKQKEKKNKRLQKLTQYKI